MVSSGVLVISKKKHLEDIVDDRAGGSPKK